MKQATIFFFLNRAIHRVIFLLAALLLFFPMVNAQRRSIPVRGPVGGGHLFPDWVMFLIFGIIGLAILFAFLGWLGDRFRDFRSFTELLFILFWIAALLSFWKQTHWGFWWCLLAGFAAAALVLSILEYLHKQIVKKN